MLREKDTGVLAGMARLGRVTVTVLADGVHSRGTEEGVSIVHTVLPEAWMLLGRVTSSTLAGSYGDPCTRLTVYTLSPLLVFPTRVTSICPKLANTLIAVTIPVSTLAISKPLEW